MTLKASAVKVIDRNLLSGTVNTIKAHANRKRPVNGPQVCGFRYVLHTMETRTMC